VVASEGTRSNTFGRDNASFRAGIINAMGGALFTRPPHPYSRQKVSSVVMPLIPYSPKAF
jgi:hypothetical protein